MTRSVRLQISLACFVVAAILLGVLLAGCGGITSDVWGTYQVEQKHYSIDGKTYRCLLIRTHKGTASLSCDWDHPLP